MKITKDLLRTVIKEELEQSEDSFTQVYNVIKKAKEIADKYFVKNPNLRKMGEFTWNKEQSQTRIAFVTSVKEKITQERYHWSEETKYVFKVKVAGNLTFDDRFQEYRPTYMYDIRGKSPSSPSFTDPEKFLSEFESEMAKADYLALPTKEPDWIPAWGYKGT